MAKAKSPDRDVTSYLKFLLGEEEEPRDLITQDQWAAPHVFVGIGGTGTQTVTRIAKRITELIGESERASGTLPGCLQFIAMDTDSSELSPAVRMMGVEVVDLTVNDPETVWAENENAFRKLGFNETLQIELGAGGRRQFGRFAFAAHADTIKRALSGAFAKARKYPGLLDNSLRVHIFFSLAGGTGSGIFLDLAFLIRDMTETQGAEVAGYVVLPDNIVATVSSYTLASAGGALKELEYFMQLGRGTFAGWANAPRAGERIEYWKGGRVKGLVRWPFDLCYLFGSRGKGQGAVPEPTKFPGVLAEAAIRSGFSEAGQWNRKRAQGGDLTTYFENDWQGKYSSFSAIGFSRLIVPTNELGAYLILRLAEAACDYLVSGLQPWDSHSKDAAALLETYTQRLTVGFSVDQVVTKNRRRNLDVGAAISELQKLHTRKKDGDIKRACDGLEPLYDQLWSESEKTRTDAVNSRVAILREQFRKHVIDLNVGLADDIAFFNGLKGQLLEHKKKASEDAEKKRVAMLRYLEKIGPVTKYLGKKGLLPWVTRDTNFSQLKAAYQLVVSGIRDCVLARANAELAGELVQQVEGVIAQLTQAVQTLASDLRARYATRRKAFHSRLRQMIYGGVSDDCKTFCPVEMERIADQAEQMLEPLRSRLGGIFGNAFASDKFDLEALGTGSPQAVEKARRDLIEILLPEIAVDQLWETLTTDAEQWERSLRERRRIVLEASTPLLLFASPPRSGVVGCYANFPTEDLDSMSGAPRDIGKHQRKSIAPLVPQSDCCEATRFFHGIRLRDLAISREAGAQYRAYMKDLQRARGRGGATEDHINLFDTLLRWTPPDEPAPETSDDELLRLWALGLCFGEVFTPDLEQQSALDNANDLARASGQRRLKNRRSYMFRITTWYYLQPFYEVPTDHAPPYIQLGRGRQASYTAFRESGEAGAEMVKWYDYAERTWSERFNRSQLQNAIREYLEGLGTGSDDDLYIQEREIVGAFMENPFPE